MGGGEGGEVPKKILQGIIERENSCTASSLEKNVLAYGKNIPSREMLTQKVRAPRKSPPPPPPPNNFSNGRSLVFSRKCLEKYLVNYYQKTSTSGHSYDARCHDLHVKNISNIEQQAFKLYFKHTRFTVPSSFKLLLCLVVKSRMMLKAEFSQLAISAYEDLKF